MQVTFEDGCTTSTSTLSTTGHTHLAGVIPLQTASRLFNVFATAAAKQCRFAVVDIPDIYTSVCDISILLLFQHKNVLPAGISCL